MPFDFNIPADNSPLNSAEIREQFRAIVQDKIVDADKVDGKHASDLASVDLSNVSDAVILTKIKNVDGSGSGLDADTLDGQHASAFASNNHTHIVWNLMPNNSYNLPLVSPITINVNSQWGVPSNAKAIIGSVYLRGAGANANDNVSFHFYFCDDDNYFYRVIHGSFAPGDDLAASLRSFVIIPIRSDGTIKIAATVIANSDAWASFYYYGYLT